MPIATIVTLLFLLIALCMVIYCFFPTWSFATGPVVGLGRIIGLVIGLIVLYIVYLLVMSILGTAAIHL